MGNGVQYRLLGDGIESHSFDVDTVERLLASENLLHVPGDRLALAIWIGGEIEPAAFGDGLRDGIEALLRLGIDFPVHGEILVRANRAILRWQVAHMTIGSQHGKTGAEVLPNGLSLGRGLDDQHVHRRNMLQ